MASATSYQDITSLKKLFAEAGEKGIMANSALAETLKSAPSLAPAWPAILQQEWCEGMEHVFETVTPSTTLPPEQLRLLQAMIMVGLDTPALRQHYAHYFKASFPNCPNPDGIRDVLGFLHEETPVLVAAGRLAVYAALKSGIRCWDSIYGLGTVLEFDEMACEVRTDQGEKRNAKLQLFLDKEALVRPGSDLEKLVTKTAGRYASAAELHQKAMEGLVTRLEVTPSLVDKMLIPGIYSASALEELCHPVSENGAGNAQKANGELSQRWDYSRSILELEGRLEKLDIPDAKKQPPEKANPIDVENPNLDNVRNLLTREAGRPQMALRWANVVAMMCKSPAAAAYLTPFLGELKDKVIAWNDQKLFVELTDKLPGKQVGAWLNMTKAIVGLEFLIETTIQMPYRLWSHTESLLASKEEHQRFVDRIFQDFQSGKPSADHYAWLWKAPKSELRTKFLSDSYLLFKTLHKDLRGSYLKSQRNLHKLLLDDENFQRAVMKDGDLEAIGNLVRCVKSVPLLDSSEKQSVLVKIVRIYKEAQPMVEENASAHSQEKPTFEDISSIHSLRMLQEELDRLVNEAIPANVAAIEEARSRGDLSENSEYKYAKEQQRELGKRRTQLENNLDSCKPVDFGDYDIDGAVIPGTVVTLHFEDGRDEKFTLLGLFDTDTEKNWLSYKSPMGQVLLSHKAGDSIRVPSGKKATIAAVEKLDEELLAFLRK